MGENNNCIYSIYKATNLMNGKCYIGFDKKWPNRKRNHLYESFNRNSDSFNTHFHKAIRKHGTDNFKWEILYQSCDGDHCLKNMEPYFISFYNSYEAGYNMTFGGDGRLGAKHSNETKRLYSEKRLGIPKSEEHKRKIKEGQLCRDKSTWPGHNRTVEEMKKVQISLLKHYDENPNKPRLFVFKPKIDLVCIICNEKYSVIPARVKTSKCCSRKCSAKYANNKRNENIRAVQ